MNSFVVYVHTSPSGKKYVGITRRAVCQRWQNGRGYIGNQKFYRAILKYGWDNFTHEIVASKLSESEALELEEKLIEEYDSFNNGYNQTSGGEKQVCCSSALRKMKDKLAVPVSQYTKDGIWITDYESLSDAAKGIGRKYTGISGCLSGRYKTCGGFMWAYKGAGAPIYKKNTRKNQYRVAQIEKGTMRVLRVFETAQIASQITGVPYGSIYEACRIKGAAYGFLWMKESDIAGNNMVETRKKGEAK